MTQIRFVSRECMSCRACEMACMERHSESGFYPDFLFERPPVLPRIRIIDKKGKVIALKCLHCKKPKCMEACEHDAISRDDGKVRIDLEKCTGCWSCVEACPFGSIQADEERGIAIKCDFCGGYDEPACISSCPTDALRIVETKQ